MSLLCWKMGCWSLLVDEVPAQLSMHVVQPMLGQEEGSWKAVEMAEEVAQQEAVPDVVVQRHSLHAGRWLFGEACRHPLVYC